MPIDDLLSEIATGVASPTVSNFPPAGNNGFRRPAEPTRRPEAQTANSSRPISDPRRDSKAISNGAKPSTSGLASNAKNGTTVSAGSTAPPKKGSFAEIMARGSAAHANMAGKVGKIQHKKIEKQPSRRQREEAVAKQAKNIQSGLKPGSKFQKAGQPQSRDGKPGSKDSSGKAGKSGKMSVEPEKKVKKAATATTGYTGTARPKPGGAPSSRPLPMSAAQRERERREAARRGNSGPSYGYASEEEEEDEVEEQDYESDVSSDMEAAAFEVDEEEDNAARIARQEDAEALREENRLKKEKMERKRRMEAMSKKAKHR